MTTIERISKFVEYQGVSIRSFEQTIGASNGLIRKAIANNTDIQSKWLSAIADNYPQLNTHWLLTGRGSMIYSIDNPAASKTVTLLQPDTVVVPQEQAIPLYEAQAIGNLGMLFADKHKSSNFIYLPNLPKCDGAIYMRGDSMDPEVRSGDVVVYRKVKDLSKGLFLGQMYLLSFELEGETHIMVKYIDEADDSANVRLVSVNKRYPPADIPRDSITHLASIKASIHYNAMG